MTPQEAAQKLTEAINALTPMPRAGSTDPDPAPEDIKTRLLFQMTSGETIIGVLRSNDPSGRTFFGFQKGEWKHFAAYDVEGGGAGLLVRESEEADISPTRDLGRISWVLPQVRGERRSRLRLVSSDGKPVRRAPRRRR